MANTQQSVDAVNRGLDKARKNVEIRTFRNRPLAVIDGLQNPLMYQKKGIVFVAIAYADDATKEVFAIRPGCNDPLFGWTTGPIDLSMKQINDSSKALKGNNLVVIPMDDKYLFVGGRYDREDKKFTEISFQLPMTELDPATTVAVNYMVDREVKARKRFLREQREGAKKIREIRDLLSRITDRDSS